MVILINQFLKSWWVVRPLSIPGESLDSALGVGPRPQSTWLAHSCQPAELPDAGGTAVDAAATQQRITSSSNAVNSAKRVEEQHDAVAPV